MTLVYESEHGQVFHGDARDILPGLPAKSVQLVIADPPYGKEWISRRRAELFDQMVGDEATDEARSGVHDVLRDALRVLVQHRHVYVFGPGDVLDGLKVSEWTSLVWDKGAIGAGDLASPWAPAHEPISFAVNQHYHAGAKGKPANPARLRKGSVLRFTRPTGRMVKRHPSEKPVQLLAELVESSSRTGDVVLDPFAGSGSTAVACILRDRRYLTIEKDEGYVKRLVDRIRTAEEAVASLPYN